MAVVHLPTDRHFLSIDPCFRVHPASPVVPHVACRNARHSVRRVRWFSVRAGYTLSRRSEGDSTPSIVTDLHRAEDSICGPSARHDARLWTAERAPQHTPTGEALYVDVGWCAATGGRANGPTVIMRLGLSQRSS